MEQVIEEKVQLILPIILRNVGPLLLRGGLGGLSGGGGGGAASNDDDDFEDDDDSGSDSVSSNDGSTSTREGAGGRKVSISLPTFPPDTDEDEEDDTDVNETSSNDNNDESNTIKSTDQTQVSSQKSKETTNQTIQTSTKPTVTTTTIGQETTQPLPLSSSITPPLIRPSSIDTTTTAPTQTPTTTPIINIQTTIPSSSVFPSENEIASEFGASEGNTNGIPITTTTTTTTTAETTHDNDYDGILTFIESSTDSDYSDETTTNSGIDFRGRIDIRSNFGDQESSTTTDDSVNVETTTNPSLGNNAIYSADSSNTNSQSVPNVGIKYLPPLKNLVRRRKAVVAKRQHHMH